MDNAHDKFFKLVYGRPRQAAAYFHSFLPRELVGRLDLSRLSPMPGSFVDEALGDRHSDLLFSVPIRSEDPKDPKDPEDPSAERAERDRPGAALLYLLFEHQSRVDPLMAFRLLRYMVRIWERWLDAPPEPSAGVRGRPLPLPPIIPLVLYHDPSGAGRGWRPSRCFEALVADPEGLFAPFTPRFCFQLTEVMKLPERAIGHVPEAPARLALWLFKHASDPGLLARFESWSPTLRETHLLRQLAGFLEYLMRTRDELDLTALGRTLRTTVNATAEHEAMTVAEQLIAQGRQEGILRGRQEGILRGRQEGILRGRHEGRREGLERAIRKLLDSRFGPLSPELDGELSRVDVTTLDAWLDRALAGASPDELFKH